MPLAAEEPPKLHQSSEPWCVFVSGSRDMTWQHEPLVREKLAPYEREYSTVIHGMGEGRHKGIPGCDRIVDQVARDLGIVAIPALWHAQGLKAGPRRNYLCAEILLAFGLAGYSLAMLAFSTGGRGTEGAHRLVKYLSETRSYPVKIEKITVTL